MIRELIPGKLKDAVKFLIRPYYYGSGRYCPVCGNSSRKFAAAGADKRLDAKCAHCGALERHRLVWKFFKEKTNLSDGRGKKMLHIAPEVFFSKRLKQIPGLDYLTADLYDNSVNLKMDITKIQFPDNSFDIIYCSHVLEHVIDDRKAMREFYRTLKSGGWAAIMVPVNSEETFEDPSVTDPKERLKLFGPSDHVRIYGHDFAGRLREAGFRVEIIFPDDFLGDERLNFLV